MRRASLAFAFLVAVTAVFSEVTGTTGAAQTIADDRASQPVVVRDVVVRDGAVSGLLTNTSPRLVRDIRLLIRHRWLWRNEKTPGTDNPGRAEYHTVRENIPPEVSVKFSYRPNRPLPVRDDGYFQTSVEVVGFAEVGD